MYWYENRYLDQWDKWENYDYLIFNKVDNNKQWKNNSLFNKLCWVNWVASYIVPNVEKDLFLSPHTKINPRLKKDFNVKSKTVKTLEENVENTIWTTAWAKNLWQSSKVISTKIKMDKYDLFKLNSICTAK